VDNIRTKRQINRQKVEQESGEESGKISFLMIFSIGNTPWERLGMIHMSRDRMTK